MTTEDSFAQGHLQRQTTLLNSMKDPSLIRANDYVSQGQICEKFKSIKLMDASRLSQLKPVRRQKREDNWGGRPTHLRRTCDSNDGLIRRKPIQTFDISLDRGKLSVRKNDQNRNLKRVNKTETNMADASRRRTDHSIYGRVHTPASEYYFELNAFDEEICKRTATRAYATQICMEGDRDVAKCLGLSAMAHDQALFEHANYVHASMVSSRQSNVLEWLKSRTDEERRMYLNYHKQDM